MRDLVTHEPPPAREPIDVLNVWYHVAGGVGQTILQHPARTPRATLRQAAIAAAEVEILARLPIGVNQPLFILDVRRGAPHSNGTHRTFVQWSVDYRPSTLGFLLGRILRFVELIPLRVYALFERR